MKYVRVSEFKDPSTNRHDFKNQDSPGNVKLECVVKNVDVGVELKYHLVRGSWLQKQIQGHAITQGKCQWKSPNRNVLAELSMSASCFSHTCDKALDKNSLREEGLCWLRVSFSPSQQELEGLLTLHPTSGSRKG